MVCGVRFGTCHTRQVHKSSPPPGLTDKQKFWFQRTFRRLESEGFLAPKSHFRLSFIHWTSESVFFWQELSGVNTKQENQYIQEKVLGTHIVGVVGTITGVKDQESCAPSSTVKTPPWLWGGVFSPHLTLESPGELLKEDRCLRLAPGENDVIGPRESLGISVF